MKTFLVMLLIFACGCAGYECYEHSEQATIYTQQRANLTYSIEYLKKQNKELSDEQASLTEKLTGLQNQAADLRSQLNATSDPSAPAPASTNSAVSAAAAAQQAQAAQAARDAQAASGTNASPTP